MPKQKQNKRRRRVRHMYFFDEQQQEKKEMYRLYVILLECAFREYNAGVKLLSSTGAKETLVDWSTLEHGEDVDPLSLEASAQRRWQECANCLSRANQCGNVLGFEELDGIAFETGIQQVPKERRSRLYAVLERLQNAPGAYYDFLQIIQSNFKGVIAKTIS